MFKGVGRRLALLNAVVVVVVIALVGSAIFLALRHSLDQEVDNALRSRIASVAALDLAGQSGGNSSNDSKKKDDEHDDREVLASGDTIVFVVDRNGQVIYNPRDVTLSGFPVSAGIKRALGGKKDVRTVDVGDAGPARVMTLPTYKDRQLTGAIQAVESLSEHESELAMVRLITFLGVGLGSLLAIPAGLYLSARAMRPISTAFQRQREFVADASHELRTPLTLIRANAELVRESDPAERNEIVREVDSIVEEVDRMDRMVDDLLVLARSDAGQLPLELEPRDVTRLARNAVDAMRPLADARGVETSVAGAPGTLALVDGQRLAQVVRILVDNAIKHTPIGGRVDVAVTSGAREIEIEVRDTGAGIAPEHLGRVFDRFYRVDRARSRAQGGTGLGLSIARTIVEGHGGQIGITSEVGQGTTVTVRLPKGEIPPVIEQTEVPA